MKMRLWKTPLALIADPFAKEQPAPIQAAALASRTEQRSSSRARSRFRSAWRRRPLYL